MTRFITYTDPVIAALEAEREDLLRRMSAIDAALDDPVIPEDQKEALTRLLMYLDTRLDLVAGRILHREAELANA